MQKNDEIVLNITDISNDGSGIGKYEGMVIFVPLTAVGDCARVKLLKVKKTYAYGKLIELLSSSLDRVEVDCPVFSKCGGCVYRHIDYSREVQLKQNRVYEVIKRIGKVDILPQPIMYENKICGYRNKAQYPISEDGKAGFFAFHSHRIIPCRDCMLQPSVFGDIVSIFEKWVEKNNISIYNELYHKGLLRHLYIRFAEATNQIMVVVVINGESLPFSEELISTLVGALGNRLKGIQININKKDTNVILGDKCLTIYGDDYITDILCGIKIRIGALSFYQVNRKMAEKLYEKAYEYAQPENKNVLDLYCGAGAIGLSMAKTAKSIIGVEIVPQAVRDAEFNAQQNNIKNARFICADAAKAALELAEKGIKTDVVIVDPPRKGCSQQLIKLIAQDFSPERVVYVSCDPATLARDISVFSSYGYMLKEYTPADLFPRTAHVETVSLLLRVEK